MNANLPEDIRDLQDQLDAAERDAAELVAGLSEERGTARVSTGSWSVAQCLDHLVTANRVYLKAMQEPASRARTQGKFRLGPARPGWVGGLFARSLEPPARRWFKLRAPRKIRPAPAPPLDEAFADFVGSQADVRAFLRVHADLDLTGIRFPNPLIRGVRFSLATGFHVITAHERRHLWQAWRIRRAVERAK